MTQRFLNVFSQTRMQSLACDKNARQSISNVLRTMVREEGVFRPIRGMNAMAAGAGPAHAMYFSAIESTRRFFNEGHGVPLHVSSGEQKSFIYSRVYIKWRVVFCGNVKQLFDT